MLSNKEKLMAMKSYLTICQTVTGIPVPQRETVKMKHIIHCAFDGQKLNKTWDESEKCSFAMNLKMKTTIRKDIFILLS